MNVSFKVCWYCPTNLDIDQFQDSTEVLLILEGVRVFFSPLGRPKSILQKLMSKFPIFNNCGAHFSVGKIINWVGNFGQWAGWIYWLGTCPPQLICYLPHWLQLQVWVAARYAEGRPIALLLIKQGPQRNAVAAVNPQLTFTAAPTCSSHSSNCVHETYVAGQRNLDVQSTERLEQILYRPKMICQDIHPWSLKWHFWTT